MGMSSKLSARDASNFGAFDLTHFFGAPAPAALLIAAAIGGLVKIANSRPSAPRVATPPEAQVRIVSPARDRPAGFGAAIPRLIAP
jgi:hypothetical protein